MTMDSLLRTRKMQKIQKIQKNGHGFSLKDTVGPIEMDLGDIYVCPETIMEKYDLKEHELRKALVPLMCHGLLHLCGYVHDNEVQSNVMYGQEKLILNDFSSKA